MLSKGKSTIFDAFFVPFGRESANATAYIIHQSLDNYQQAVAPKTKLMNFSGVKSENIIVIKVDLY